MSWSSGSGDDPGKAASDPAKDSAGRREEVRAAVIEMVRSRRAVAEDQERLDGYLRDVCPNDPAEIAVVVVAARSGVPDDLSRATEGHAVEATVARLAARLHAESGVDRELARWAVDTWAVALGRIPAGEAAPAAGRLPPPDAEALRAMVARGPIPPARPDPSEAQPATAQPAPLVEQPTRLPPAPAPTPVASPPRTRTRPPAASPPPPPDAAAGPRRRVRVLVPAALVTVVALVALVVALTGGDGKPTAATGPSTSAAGAATSAVTTEAPRPFPSDTVALAPATYKSSVFKPGMMLTVGQSWKVLFPETQEFLQIVRTDGAPGGISLVHLTRVFPPSAVYRTEQDAAKPGAVDTVPNDVLGWLAANPNLSVSRPTPAKIAGASGSQVEVSVPSGYDTTLCGDGCVPLWPFTEQRLGVGFLSKSKRNLVQVLDVGGDKVLVLAVSTIEGYSTFLPEAERVLASLAFTR